MALHTRSGFADHCGVPRQYVTTYISRSKIFLNSDGFIDDTFAPNKETMVKWLEKSGHVPSEVAQESLAFPTPADDMQAPKSARLQDPEKYNLLQRKVGSSIQKNEVETRLKLLREEQMRGELVPSAMAKDIVSELSQSFVSSFKNGAENIIIEMAHMKAFSVDETASLRAKLTGLVNSCTKNAVDVARGNMNRKLHEYSKLRNVGEHG